MMEKIQLVPPMQNAMLNETGETTMKAINIQNQNINRKVNAYNADVQSAFMEAILGEEVWSKYKPRKSIFDALNGPQNDN
jgi:hypothetical protein